MRTVTLGVVLAIGSLLGSCADGDREAQLSALAAWTPEAMGEIEPQVRRQLDRALATLESRRQRRSTDEEVAAAVGELAMLHHVYGNHEEALWAYELSAEMDPSDPRWPYYRGYLLDRLGRADEAAEAYREGLRIDRDLVTARLRLVEVETDLGHLDGAAQTLAEVPSAIRETARGLVVAGELALASADFAAASELLRRAAELEPQSNRVRLGLGQALRESGEIEEARAVLEGAGQVSAQDAELGLADPLLAALYEHKISSQYLWELGRVHLAAGRLPEAEEQFRRALEAQPHSEPYRTDLGNALVKAGALQAAVVEFELVLVQSPDYLPALASLAKTQARLGRQEEAIATYSRLLELSEAHPGIHLELANVYRVMGDFTAAERHYRRALELDRSLQNAYVWLGFLDALRGDRQGALTTFQKGLKVLPESRWLQALEMRLDIALAEEAALPALLRPTLQRLLEAPVVFNGESLALLYARAGEFDEAAHWQEVALSVVEGAGTDDTLLRRRLTDYRSARITAPVLDRLDTDTVDLALPAADVERLRAAGQALQ